MKRAPDNDAGVTLPVAVAVDRIGIPDLELPRYVSEATDLATVIPRVARDAELVVVIEAYLKRLSTSHDLRAGDARAFSFVADESVHLIVTSPPYWNLKKYPGRDGQLGAIGDYDQFVDELTPVWRECARVLVPGGRLVVVVGDVCLSRRRHGRHRVMALHASIQESCRSIGLDNLAPIIWYKIANAAYEANGNGSGYLGKPYEPNSVVKNDIEFILMQRKPGGYRRPSYRDRILSVIPQPLYREWFKQVWTLPGASTRNHPAPFPETLAERLVRMFSFAGDTVLDPFMGMGTTNVAAARWGRNSIGIEIDPDYVAMAERRLRRARARVPLH